MNPRIPDVGPGAILIQKLRQRYSETDVDRFTDAYWRDLQKEYAVHVAAGQMFFPLGLIAGAFLFPAIKGGFTWWDVGVGFGSGIALAFGYQLLVCAKKGFEVAYAKMADYSTMMYGIPWRLQFRLVYLPMLLAGSVCALGRFLTT